MACDDRRSTGSEEEEYFKMLTFVTDQMIAVLSSDALAIYLESAENAISLIPRVCPRSARR